MHACNYVSENRQNFHFFSGLVTWNIELFCGWCFELRDFCASSCVNMRLLHRKLEKFTLFSPLIFLNVQFLQKSHVYAKVCIFLKLIFWIAQFFRISFKNTQLFPQKSSTFAHFSQLAVKKWNLFAADFLNAWFFF